MPLPTHTRPWVGSLTQAQLRVERQPDPDPSAWLMACLMGRGLPGSVVPPQRVSSTRGPGARHGSAVLLLWLLQGPPAEGTLTREGTAEAVQLAQGALTAVDTAPRDPQSSSLEDAVSREVGGSCASVFLALSWLCPCCRDFQGWALSQSVATVSLSQMVEVSVSLR